MEACNFLEKQRELFAARRKKQADAIEFLHHYRADDKLVLRKAAAARHSLGSNSYKYSARHNLTTSRWSLSPSKVERRERQPDAHSPVYSYATYPTLTRNKYSSTVTQDDISEEPSPLLSPPNPPNIDQIPIHFKSAFETLEITAEEASRVPLPGDIHNGDNENSFENTEPLNEGTQKALRCDKDVQIDGEEDEINGKNNEHSSFLQSAKEKETLIPLGDRGNCDVLNNENTKSSSGDEVDKESDHPILILDGEIDFEVNTEEERDSRVSLSKNVPLNGDVKDCGTESKVDIGSSSAQFIPFEAFSKLGESLIMGSLCKTHSEENDNDDDDEKMLIEGESDDDSIIPGESFMQLGASMMANNMLSSKDEEEEVRSISTEKSERITTTGTASTVSQRSAGSKPLSVNKQTNNGTLDNASSRLGKSLFDGDRLETVAVIDHQFTKSRSRGDGQLKEVCQSKKLPDDNSDILKSTDEDSDINFECSSVVEKQEHFDRSSYSGVMSSAVKTPKKSNLTAERSDSADPNDVDHRSDTEEKPQGSGNEEPNSGYQTSSAKETPQENGNEEPNALDHKGSTKEELHENGKESVVNNRDTSPLPVRNVASLPPQNRRKKKKDKSYYPSSGLFVSRQFLSR
mmetsp:Transcript_13241/g.27773  ORF Transcript_13241/g.27773 Transcript_13241/m.27773 type:complete len:632 (-) Transcript_13241:109-2004(-)